MKVKRKITSIELLGKGQKWVVEAFHHISTVHLNVLHFCLVQIIPPGVMAMIRAPVDAEVPVEGNKVFTMLNIYCFVSKSH